MVGKIRDWLANWLIQPFFHPSIHSINRWIVRYTPTPLKLLTCISLEWQDYWMISGNDLTAVCFTLLYSITLALVWVWEPNRTIRPTSGLGFLCRTAWIRNRNKANVDSTTTLGERHYGISKEDPKSTNTAYCNVLMTKEMYNSYNQFYSTVFCLLYMFRTNLVVHHQQHGIMYCITYLLHAAESFLRS